MRGSLRSWGTFENCWMKCLSITILCWRSKRLTFAAGKEFCSVETGLNFCCTASLMLQLHFFSCWFCYHQIGLKSCWCECYSFDWRFRFNLFVHYWLGLELPFPRIARYQERLRTPVFGRSHCPFTYEQMFATFERPRKQRMLTIF